MWILETFSSAVGMLCEASFHAQVLPSSKVLLYHIPKSFSTIWRGFGSYLPQVSASSLFSLSLFLSFLSPILKTLSPPLTNLEAFMQYQDIAVTVTALFIRN